MVFVASLLYFEEQRCVKVYIRHHNSKVLIMDLLAIARSYVEKKKAFCMLISVSLFL